MRRPRKVFTKRELFAAAWREEPVVEEKTVNTHIGNIRAKLKGTGTEGYIETVWGIGFKLARVQRRHERSAATLAPPLPWAPCRRTPAPAAASACPAPASSFPILSLSYNFAEGFRKPRR